MKTFLDSSAYAKRLVEEPGSEQVERACLAATELGVSVLCVPEVISALNRRLREKVLDRRRYLQLKRRLGEDILDAEVTGITPEVVGEAVGILEANPVGAMDALHVACALAWGAELFVSGDARQVAAARKHGLRCEAV